MDMDILTFEWM